MKKILTGIFTIGMLMVAFLAIPGCAKIEEGLKDGYYSAEMAEYSHGWKEYITISVKGGNIVSVEYNARNASGFIKSWDMAYMRTMNMVKGTYPNRYTRTYGSELLQDQTAEDIDAVAGATHSFHLFTELAQAVLNSAKTGDTSVVIVSAPNEG